MTPAAAPSFFSFLSGAAFLLFYLKKTRKCAITHLRVYNYQ